MKNRLSTDPNRLLTPLMCDALRKAATSEGLGSWDFAAGILGSLKAAGLVVRSVGPGRPYILTEAGKLRLEGVVVPSSSS